MNKNKMNITCPYCGSGIISRLPRKFWMKLLPDSKRMGCNHCRGEFLSVLADLVIPLKERFSRSL